MIVYLFLAISLLLTGQSKQVYMATVFRHGARYPLNNLYDGKQTAPFHGQLSGVGLRQQYLLGSYIQNDYMDKDPYLNKTLNPREVQIFALGSERCTESVYGHVFGLFSFSQGQVINPNINADLLNPPFETILPQNLKSQRAPSGFALDNGFQPVPIRNGDLFFPKCQNENNIFIKRGQVAAARVAQIQAQYALFTQEMKVLFNLTLAEANIGGLAQLFDTLISDTFLGRPLPTKFTDQDMQKLNFIQSYLFTLVYEEHPARIFNAPFVNHLISNMQNVINGKLGVKKISVYGGHDSNVVPLLTYFNLTSSECLKRQFKNHTITGNCAIPVPFASSIFFQLHRNEQNTSNFYVKVRYNGKYYNLCQKNTTQCAFQQFSSRSLNNLMDFNKECAKPKYEKQEILLQQ